MKPAMLREPAAHLHPHRKGPRSSWGGRRVADIPISNGNGMKLWERNGMGIESRPGISGAEG